MWRIIFTPLNWFRNWYQCLRSDLAILLSLTCCDGFVRPLVRSIRPLRKGLPGLTTLLQKFNSPITLCNSFNVTTFLLAMLRMDFRAFSNLSEGKEICIFTVSTWRPCNSTTVEGWTVFSCLMGRPIDSANCRNDWRATLHCWVLHSPKNMKSSKICDIRGTCILLIRIHCIAEANFSKMLQALLSPMVRDLSK